MIFARSLKSVYKHAPLGMHGYDRFDQDMQATFIAAGPNFKKGVSAKAIEMSKSTALSPGRSVLSPRKPMAILPALSIL